MGGGTFDVSISTIDNGYFETVATLGAQNLGGEDFNDQIMRQSVTKFNEEYKCDVRKSSSAMMKL